MTLSYVAALAESAAMLGLDLSLLEMAAAVLACRLVTFGRPVVPGALALHWLRRRHLL